MPPNLEAWKTLIVLVGVAVVVVLGTITIHRSRRDAHGVIDEQASTEDLFADLKAAYEAGQMDTAEFQRIQASLGVEHPPATRRPKRRPT